MVPLADCLCRGTRASLNRLRLHARWGKEEEVEEEMEAEKLAVGALRLLRRLQVPLGGGRAGSESPWPPQAPHVAPTSTMCICEEPGSEHGLKGRLVSLASRDH